MYDSNKFMQIMKFFPKEVFDLAVSNDSRGIKRRKFTYYNQMVSMIFHQINGCQSLRGLVTSFNAHPESHYHLKMHQIKRSTLSEANNKANPEIFIAVLKKLMTSVAPKLRKEISSFVNIIDSSPISLKGSRFDDWTGSNKTSRIQGLKLHLGINTDAKSITEFEISDANKNDITIAKEWNLKPNQMYIFDKGYYDYNWWQRIVKSGSSFVTRAKKDAALKLVRTLEIESENIISDEVVVFKHRTPRGGKKNLYIKELRRVTVRRDEKKTPLILLTNRFDLKAEQIAALYKERWEVELFFKWIKQKLRIKKLIGNSKNAVTIQIVTALISYLLLALYKKATQAKGSLGEFLIYIKETLFYRTQNEYKRRKERKNNNIAENQMVLAYV